MENYNIPVKFPKDRIPNGAKLMRSNSDERKKHESHIAELISAIGETEGTAALKEEMKQWQQTGIVKISDYVIDCLRGEQSENTVKADGSRKGILGGLVTRSYVEPLEQKSKNIGLLVHYLVSLRSKM